MGFIGTKGPFLGWVSSTQPRICSQSQLWFCRAEPQTLPDLPSSVAISAFLYLPFQPAQSCTGGVSVQENGNAVTSWLQTFRVLSTCIPKPGVGLVTREPPKRILYRIQPREIMKKGTKPNPPPPKRRQLCLLPFSPICFCTPSKNGTQPPTPLPSWHG